MEGINIANKHSVCKLTDFLNSFILLLRKPVFHEAELEHCKHTNRDKCDSLGVSLYLFCVTP